MPPWCHWRQLPDPPQPVECYKWLDHCFWGLYLWPDGCMYLCLVSADTCVHLCHILQVSQTPCSIQLFLMPCTIIYWLHFYSWSKSSSIHILEVGIVPYSLCRKLKWAIIIRAIQVSNAPSDLLCSYQILPSQRMHLEFTSDPGFSEPILLVNI